MIISICCFLFNVLSVLFTWFHVAAILISLKPAFGIKSTRKVNICKLRIFVVISTYIVLLEEKMLNDNKLHILHAWVACAYCFQG